MISGVWVSLGKQWQSERERRKKYAAQKREEKKSKRGVASRLFDFSPESLLTRMQSLDRLLLISSFLCRCAQAAVTQLKSPSVQFSCTRSSSRSGSCFTSFFLLQLHTTVSTHCWYHYSLNFSASASLPLQLHRSLCALCLHSQERVYE